MSDQKLSEKVVEWLHETGFPLEMETAFAFREANFFVRQSAIYCDPESRKGREIDVLASLNTPMGMLGVSFVIECKASQKPWVVLRSPDALLAFNRISAFGVLSAGAWNGVWRRSFDDTRVPLREYIDIGDAGGYGFRQALGRGEDTAFAAAMSVMKACVDLTESVTQGSMLFAFPVIVVDAPLFEAELDKHGNVLVNQVSRSSFLFSTQLAKEVSTRITVVTRGSLKDYARYARELALVIQEEFRHDEKARFESFME